MRPEAANWKSAKILPCIEDNLEVFNIGCQVSGFIVQKSKMKCNMDHCLMFNLLKQIILLFEPEYKSIQIGPNLEVFQKIWKSSGKSGSLPYFLEDFQKIWKSSGKSGSLPDFLEVFRKIWKSSRKCWKSSRNSGRSSGKHLEVSGFIVKFPYSPDK